MFRKKAPGSDEMAPPVVAPRAEPAAEEPKPPQPRRPATLPIRPLANPGVPPDLARRTEPAPRRTEPAPAAAAVGPAPALVREKCLLIGKGVKLRGEVTACEKVVVEGEAELVLSDGRTLQVAPTGVFRGRAEVIEADIAGLFEGEIIARERLAVQTTGRMSGKISYGQITIATGGRVSGELSGLPPAAAAAPRAVPPGAGASGERASEAEQAARLPVAATDRP